MKLILAKSILALGAVAFLSIVGCALYVVGPVILGLVVAMAALIWAMIVVIESIED